MSINSLVNNPQIIDELKLIFGGSSSVVSATLPLVVSSNDVSLPISGVWSATNNVLKSSSSTVLEWGTDGGGGTSLIFNDLSLPIISTFFDTTENIGMRTVLNSGVSTTYYQKGDPSDFPTASVVIIATNSATLTLNIPLNFPLSTPTYVPIVALNLNTPSNITTSYATIIGVSPTVATFQILTNNLIMNIGDQIIFNFPPFSLYNGQ